MARYYNKTSGLLTVTLKNGSAAVVPSKQWLPVESKLDGSSDLQKKVRKGLLVRREDPESTPAPAPTPAPAADTAPASDFDTGSEVEEDPPDRDWRKTDLMAYAEDKGLDVSGMTKAQILEVIEGAA